MPYPGVFWVLCRYSLLRRSIGSYRGVPDGCQDVSGAESLHGVHHCQGSAKYVVEYVTDPRAAAPAGREKRQVTYTGAPGFGGTEMYSEAE